MTLSLHAHKFATIIAATSNRFPDISAKLIQTQKIPNETREHLKSLAHTANRTSCHCANAKNWTERIRTESLSLWCERSGIARRITNAKTARLSACSISCTQPRQWLGFVFGASAHSLWHVLLWVSDDNAWMRTNAQRTRATMSWEKTGRPGGRMLNGRGLECKVVFKTCAKVPFAVRCGMHCRAERREVFIIRVSASDCCWCRHNPVDLGDREF